MALSIIGTPAAAAANNITLPTHAVGDIIVIWAYRDGNANVAAKPTAGGTVPSWVDISSATGAASNSARSAYFVATANNHTSGTWTNATGMVAIVLRGQGTTPIGGFLQSGGTGTNTAQAPAITLTNSDGSSVLLEFYGHRTVTAWSAAPAGYTRQASVATEVALNTKDSTTSDGAISQANTAVSSGYRGEQIEILAAIAPTVTTQAVTSITSTTATGNGNVTSDGGSPITERGVCWSTSANPTTADSKATAAGTTGAYTASITGLTVSLTYHVRAYAINALGTSYGSDVTFTAGASFNGQAMMGHMRAAGGLL